MICVVYWYSILRLSGYANLVSCLNQGAPERRSLQLRCTLGAIRPEVRYAKWAGGSRSQTHRRAAKGSFTQDDGYVQGVAPDAHDPLLLRILLEHSSSS